jgi:hypothetical protein
MRQVMNKIVRWNIWRRKTGVPLLEDGYMRTCRTNWKGCMTLSTVSVLTTIKIGLSGTRRRLVSSLSSPLTSTWVDLMLVLALKKFGKLKFLWKSEFSCGWFHRTKDNLTKWKWKGNTSYAFCIEKEDGSIYFLVVFQLNMFGAY